MPARAKWTDFPKYPVISSLAVASIAVSIAWWAKADISGLFETAEIRRGQLWRLATSVLPHVSFLHLAFNLYWVWAFGTVIERVLGHWRAALLTLLFAVGANAVDYGFATGGVGLSGVGYGFFGLLYVLSRRDERFRGELDRNTEVIFGAWFFFCILTTVTHTYEVANVAHAAGAVLGILVGFAIALPARRSFAAAGAGAIVAVGLWGSTLGRPMVNLSGKGGFEEGRWGYDALVSGRNQEAVRWLRDAAKMQPKMAVYWYDLGIAYQRLGNVPAATVAYQRAREIEPDNPNYSNALSGTK